MEFFQKIPLNIQNKRYQIKTLESDEELDSVLKFRYKIFYTELLNKKLNNEKDQDEFDILCDHLVVIDKEANEIVGCYRLMCSSYYDDFYSGTEFNIDDVKNLNGIKLELGRACIDKQRRSGIILMMLWKGIIEYSRATKSDYLFGCSSVKTMDLMETARISNALNRRGYVLNSNVHVTPKEKFRIDNFDDYREKVGEEEPHYEIPSLLESYFKAGVKVFDQPALDKDFKCVDFFTILKFDEMNPKYLSRIG